MRCAIKRRLISPLLVELAKQPPTQQHRALFVRDGRNLAFAASGGGRRRLVRIHALVAVIVIVVAVAVGCSCGYCKNLLRRCSRRCRGELGQIECRCRIAKCVSAERSKNAENITDDQIQTFTTSIAQTPTNITND